VLDFGHVIASGTTQEVLRDPKVMAAYIGTAEVL
jgi:ABC-type branched-subunit amino acid transport system ATPase component